MTLELTEEEFDEVVDELTKRVKDTIYMNLQNEIRNKVTNVLKRVLNSEDTFTWTWSIRMTFGDIKQIVGRLRRNRNE